MSTVCVHMHLQKHRDPLDPTAKKQGAGKLFKMLISGDRFDFKRSRAFPCKKGDV